MGQHSWELGLGVGLYQDLAVSVAPGGAEAWANQTLYALDVHIGSPPDDFNLKGQDWACRRRSLTVSTPCLCPFCLHLRQNMRATGALRIDHVMALMRLYWILQGGRADSGAIFITRFTTCWAFWHWKAA